MEQNKKYTCLQCGKPISDVEYIRYGGVCMNCFSSKSGHDDEIEYRGNKIVSKYNGRTFDYYFYLIDDDEDVEEFGPYDSEKEAKCTMDRILDDDDCPYHCW